MSIKQFPAPKERHKPHVKTQSSYVEITHLGSVKSDDPAQSGKPYFTIDLIEGGERLNICGGIGIKAALEIAVEQIGHGATSIRFKSEGFGDE